VGSLTFYLNSTDAATTVYLGIYADNAGNPGSLLTQGHTSAVTKGAWNTMAVPNATVVAGTRYWLAILGTAGGKPVFRDRASGSCASQTSSQTNLTQLPATWTKGTVYADCPISAYATAVVASSPILTLSSTSIAFSAVPSGPDPTPATVNLTNTGTGTLSYTTGSDAAWLTVTPPSGSAPSSLQVSAAAAGLSVGSYTGHVTVTASGAQNSPAVITVNLTVAPAADWSMVDHDPGRSGNAVEETTITPSNVGNLSLSWKVAVDGPVTAQPLFASGVAIGGQTKDVLIVATNGNSVYALDAATGATIWRRNFGTQSSNCAIPGGFGVTGAPLIDRATSRVYAVSDDGKFRTVSLVDGTEVATALTLVTPNPGTNKVWGGLNKIGNYVYVATASDGCDTQPWKGQVYRVDVSSTPTLVNAFVVVPGIAGTNPGGGIWGYGGVSADPATGNIYGATGADVNELYTPYGDRVIELDGTLNLLGSFGPSEPGPGQFPCNGAPCDLDFGATPLVFQPAGCSTLAVVGNKNGNLYLFSASSLASSSAPLQILTLNPANDSLGAGGVGGVPAYWAAGNMVYVTDAGPGINGISAGIVGLNVVPAAPPSAPSCTLAVAWSTPMGVTGNPNSTPTVANGVVFAGDGTGPVHAFDATNGTLLWSSSSSSYNAAATYAAPIVAQGHVYAGSWSNFSGGGMVGAFSLNAATQVLSVSPTSVSFNAVQGGSNPASTPVSVTNTGTGALSFTAVSDSAWLGVTPTSGSAPQNLQVSANIAGLAPNTYTGHITVTAAGAQGSPATITVTLVVTAPPALTLSPTSVNFSATQGGSNPASSPVSLTNTGGGTLSYTTSSDSAWLSVTPGTGNAPQTLQVGANIAGLAPNTYTGHITVTAAGATGSPGTITVTLTVNAAAPVLTLSPTSVSVSATQGGSNPASSPVSLTNTGGGTLSYTTSSDSAWLSVTPASGSAPQTLTVAANIAGLAANTYTGHITVTAAGATGSPGTITVTLTVTAATPKLTLSTTTATFAATQGGSNPAAVPVNLTNTGGGTLSYTTSSDSAWLSVSPTSGGAPQTLQVAANIAGLAANTYTGHITVTAAGATGSPATITATLTVNSASAILLGDSVIEPQTDSDANGRAEAFQVTSSVAGSLSFLTLYVDTSSTSTKMYVGLYADNNGDPGALLAQGSATPTKGAWNTVTVPATNISAGSTYWIAVLGTTSGTLVFRDRRNGPCNSQSSSQTTLAALPATWTTGSRYSDCPLSAYGQNSSVPAATAIAVTGGNNQSGSAGSQLAQSLTVLVTDQFGNPFSGASVTFSDNGSGGNFSGSNPVLTGANGTASQTYRLPATGGPVTINATAAGVGSPAVFSETSLIPTIAIVSGNNQSAVNTTQLPQALVVLVTDGNGNPVSGNNVTFSDNGAGGTFSNSNPVATGANGTASQMYTLPSTTGTITINAAATGIATNAVFSEKSTAPGVVGSFTLVHSSPATIGCSGTSTCSVALTGPMSANNLATVQCIAGSAVTISSVSAGGTLIPVASTESGSSSTGYNTGGYIYPTTATAGPIVVTFSAAMGSGTSCNIREYSISAGTPQLDWAHSTLNTGTTSLLGETPVFGGSNDLVVQSASTSYGRVSAISSYTDGAFNASGSRGFADSLNTTSTTAPKWTVTTGSGNAAISGMAFATDATPCVDVAFLDWSGGTNGNVPTAATLAASTHGYADTAGLWSAPGSAQTYSTGSVHDLIHPLGPVCGNRATYTTQSMKLHTNLAVSSTTGSSSINLPATNNAVSIGCWFKNTLESTNTHQYLYGPGIRTSSSNDFMTLMCHAGQCYLEDQDNPNGNPNVGTKYTYSGSGAGPWWVTLLLQKGGPGVNNKLSIYDTSGNLLNAEEKATNTSSPTAPTAVRFGFGDDNGTSAHTGDLSGCKIDRNGNFPLLP
jgi:hypothetical protein